MALSVKVGSITSPAAVGNQAYTGIGFQPKVVIFFGNGETVDGSHGSNSSNSFMPCYLGFGTATAEGVVSDHDDFTSGDPAQYNVACIAQRYAAGASYNWHIEASMVSLDADGFTLDWTHVTTGIVVNYLALGGTELQAKVVNPTVPAATGSWGITGAGFQPDAAIVLLGRDGNTSSYGMGGFGFVSKQGATVKQGCATTSYNAGVGQYQRTDQAIALVDGATKRFEASHTSMDADGMTLNVTTFNGVSNAVSAVLFLKGVQISTGAITQKTSTGTQANTGYGFQPKALLLGGVPKTAGTTVGTAGGVDWMFGAADGTNRGVVNKVSNANGVDTLDRTKVYKELADNSTPTVLAAADLSTFDADGFTLNYTTADATARQVLALAFGDPAGGGGTPQTVAVTGLGSQQAFGSVSVHSVLVQAVAGLASEQAFGAVTPLPGPVTKAIAGLASEQAFGTVTPLPGPITVAVGGLASEQAFGSVSVGAFVVPVVGLGSEQAFGAVTVHGSIFVPVAGLGSEQAFGSVTPHVGPVTVALAGLASEQAFGGVTPLEHTTVPVAGLASEQAFGSVTPIVGPVLVLIPGLGSEQAFGTAVIQGGIGPSFGPAQAGRHPRR